MGQFVTFWAALGRLFQSFQFKDLLDVALVSFIIYNAIKLIRETRAAQLVKGIILVAGVWLIALAFNLYVMTSLLQYLFQFGLLAVVVLFQPELRRALEQIGRTGNLNGAGKKFFGAQRNWKSEEQETRKLRGIIAIVDSCEAMSRSKTGALIVFERHTRLGEIINTGTVVNAVPSAPIICNIFFNKAPLHDGAMIIRDGMVYAAGCILPLTKDETVDINLGTRHRAAIGMSENSDAVVVVVSEETGQISIALNGSITRNYTRETLKEKLCSLLLEESVPKKKWNGFFSKRGRKKS